MGIFFSSATVHDLYFDGCTAVRRCRYNFSFVFHGAIEAKEQKHKKEESLWAELNDVRVSAP